MTEQRAADARFSTSQLEENDGLAANPTGNRTLGEIVASRFSRRDFMKGSLAVSAIAATLGPLALVSAGETRAAECSAFAFDELEAGIDDTHHVAPGYDADVLLRWGDPLFADSPEFDPMKQSAQAQSRQFGYNNDYLGYIPIDGSTEHGLLVVNHEYTSTHLMFPGIVKIIEKDSKKWPRVAPLSKEQVDVEMAAHGGTIVEIRKDEGKWRVVRDGKLNRRITANTEIALSGPVAGHDRVKTNADPSGTKVFGTINNCSGGITPWGTYVSGEENINGYFSGDLPEGHKEAGNYKRFGIPHGAYEWAAYYDRFDVGKEPHEANRFGWIVEVDVNDPTSTPKKRTAMGRVKHEGAESIVAKDGRVVFYLGDDEAFEYVYKFVTTGKFNPDDPAANRDLLDDGTLHVARFAEDGSHEWLPLVFGQGPLTAGNGFASQADVLIETRRAADLLGATKMDRSEDIRPNAVNGKVYVMLTNNAKRKADQVDACNPRAENVFGHIIEIAEDGGDFAATKGKWEVLLKCGDPAVAAVGATFSTATTANGWFGMPDNCAIDSAGRLWVATDGQGPKTTGRTDGLWAVDTEGPARATSKLFFRVPIGAELCGPQFLADGQTAFVAVQHPGEGGYDWGPFGRPSYYEDPSTRWPDFKPDMPPRPAVVVITKRGGGKIAA